MKICFVGLDNLPVLAPEYREHYIGGDSVQQTLLALLYQWDRVREASATASLVLFVGTSFSVGVTELILEAAIRRQATVYSVDPNPVGVPDEVRHLPVPAEDFLPALAGALGAPTAL